MLHGPCSEISVLLPAKGPILTSGLFLFVFYLFAVCNSLIELFDCLIYGLGISFLFNVFYALLVWNEASVQPIIKIVYHFLLFCQIALVIKGYECEN